MFFDMCVTIVVFLISTGLLADLFVNTSLSLEDRVMFCGKSHFEQALCDPKKVVSKIINLN